MPTPKKDSNLLAHAEAELTLLGYAEEDKKDILSVIDAAAKLNMSGGQASSYVPAIQRLLEFKPLTDLTDDPDEWTALEEPVRGGGILQSKRWSDAFSEDGQFYYLLSESDGDNRGPLYATASKTPTEAPRTGS